MKKISLIVCMFAVFALFSLETKASQMKIVSGEMIFGGTAFGTPDYQTYTRFSLTLKSRNPQRTLQMDALQVYSVYLNHPIRPTGDYEYNIVMPYGPQRLAINSVAIYPVWFEDCLWKINSSVTTPDANAASPQFITRSSPFSLTGNSAFFGANSSVFKVRGGGTVEIMFEKIDNKYFFREAKYIFTESPQVKESSK